MSAEQAWTVAEAKLSEVIDRARTAGPQTITRVEAGAGAPGNRWENP